MRVLTIEVFNILKIYLIAIKTISVDWESNADVLTKELLKKT